MTAKLVEINLVMGIVKLALVVLAMVLSAAPLPFSDQLGPDALHVVWAVATLFFLVASDYFQVVRLKGFVEFWKMFRGSAFNKLAAQLSLRSMPLRIGQNNRRLNLALGNRPIFFQQPVFLLCAH